MKKIYLCAICNALSGGCEEDCAFCAQSAKYGADITTFAFKDESAVAAEALAARQSKAVAFCLVTSGAELSDEKVEYVSRCAARLKEEVPELLIIACNGIASKEALKELKKHGVDIYNHNLESSERHYKNLCSTMQWRTRYETCENAKSAGLALCCGGIFGVGEMTEDRESFFDALSSLAPMSVPLNFYHPNDALPIRQAVMDTEEALGVIRTARQKLPKSMLMAAGGRQVVFGERQAEMFEAGIDAIIIGDYLTTSGTGVSKELQQLSGLNVEIADSCDFGG